MTIDKSNMRSKKDIPLIETNDLELIAKQLSTIKKESPLLHSLDVIKSDSSREILWEKLLLNIVLGTKSIDQFSVSVHKTSSMEYINYTRLKSIFNRNSTTTN